MRMQFILAAAMAAIVPISAAENQSQQELNTQAKVIVQQFVSQLKPQLKAGIKSGGPQEAVEVCAEQAPLIAKNISEKSGWNITRVSLKARNPNAMPDAWEAKILTQFEEQAANGALLKQLNADVKTATQYRYMQAQVTEGVCMLCHAQNISAEVTKVIADHYPNDKAIGYQLGQVRGAISLKKAL